MVGAPPLPGAGDHPDLEVGGQDAVATTTDVPGPVGMRL
jgi:hypothetical protein